MKQHAPAAERNKTAILSVLESCLPAEGVVLEVASGTGQHAAYFADRLTQLYWQPTDISDERLASIAAWAEGHAADRLLPPRHLDVTEPEWQQPWQAPSLPLGAEAASRVVAVVSINMIHIAPWEAAVGLVSGAGALLSVGGVLVIYGPFRRHGAHTAPSNAAFDASLRAQDPAWGIRDLEEVIALAHTRGFVVQQLVEMPANNFSVVFEKHP